MGRSEKRYFRRRYSQCNYPKNCEEACDQLPNALENV